MAVHQDSSSQRKASIAYDLDPQEFCDILANHRDSISYQNIDELLQEPSEVDEVRAKTGEGEEIVYEDQDGLVTIEGDNQVVSYYLH